MSILKILFACFILLVINGCEKKYQDGPNISLKSEEARLARKWQVQLAYKSVFTDKPTNGEDQTLEWQNLTIEFKDDKTYLLENFNLDLTIKTIETGIWEFTDDFVKVNTKGYSTQYDVETNSIVSEGVKNNTWRVMRLSKKELWVWYQNQVEPPWIYMQFDALK